MSYCKPEQVGTKERGNMLKRIQVLEDGRVLAKEVTHWKIEGQNGESLEKDIGGFSINSRWKVFMAQKGFWHLTKLCKTEVPYPGKKATPSESFRHCMKRIS